MNQSDKVERLRKAGYKDTDIATILDMPIEDLELTSPTTEVTVIDKEQPIIDMAYKEQDTDDDNDPAKALRIGALSMVRVVSSKIESGMTDKDIRLVSDTLVKMSKVIGGTSIYVQNNVVATANSTTVLSNLRD